MDLVQFLPTPAPFALGLPHPAALLGDIFDDDLEYGDDADDVVMATPPPSAQPSPSRVVPVPSVLAPIPLPSVPVVRTYARNAGGMSRSIVEDTEQETSQGSKKGTRGIGNAASVGGSSLRNIPSVAPLPTVPPSNLPVGVESYKSRKRRRYRLRKKEELKKKKSGGS